MYKIFADDTLIYDSTLEDYKIGKGSIALETNKSGSFSFSIYPDHFYYDKFVRLKTIITVYKAGKIVFRGRILSDVTDYWNNKNITCEGELGFLQDSIIRPFDFSGTPEDLFKKFIEEHNAQVDDFKKFKVGIVTVGDPNNSIARSNAEYETSLSNLNSHLLEDSLGGYFSITHGDNGTDPIPTINYVIDFTKVASQKIEFGSNLKNYTKTIKANDIVTAIIPLGHEVDDGNDNSENKKLTIASVNDGKDYVYSEEGVALYGWIFKTVSFDDITDASELKIKATEYVKNSLDHNITVELTAIDLHLIDPTIETFCLNDRIRATSKPHNFDATLLCTKQTIDLLKPENDTLTLGYNRSTFVQSTTTKQKVIEKKVQTIDSSVESVADEVGGIYEKVETTVKKQDKIISDLSIRVDEINASVSNGVTAAELALKIDDEGVARISAEADEIVLEGNKVSIDSDHFKLEKDGSLICSNATLNEVTLTNDGSRGTLTIDQGGLEIGNSGYETLLTANTISVSAPGGKVDIGASSLGGYITGNYSEEIEFTSLGAYLTGTWYGTSSEAITSDINKKHDIEALSASYSALFDGLTPRLYKYNDGTSERVHVGFIAQEVEAAIDSVGLTTQDFAGFVRAKCINKETKTLEEVCCLRYEEFIALCVNEIQQLKKEVRELKNNG